MFFLCIYEFKTNKVVYSGLHEVGGGESELDTPEKCKSLSQPELCQALFTGLLLFFLLFSSKTEVLEPLNPF